MEAHRNLHDQTNDCRSFGSNAYLSSQSRKISIGVMAESKPTTRCGAKIGGGAVVPNIERVISSQEKFSGEKSKAGGMTACSKVKQIGGPKTVECSWMSKSFYQITPTSETILQANKTSRLLISAEGQNKPDGIGGAAGVQYFSYQTSNFPSNNYKKFDGETSRSCRRNDRKDKTPEEKAEVFTFTTAPKVIESDKSKEEDKINKTENRTENLRMKLCQILGTTSSPKVQNSGSHTRNMEEENTPLVQHLKQKENKFVKSTQNSDTIETDSENSNTTRKRPVTRSRSRKKTSTQKQRGKGKSGPISKDAEKHQEKSRLSFEEKRIGRVDAIPNDGSSMSSKKKSQGKNSRIGRHKTCFNENYTTDKLHQDNLKSDPPLHNGVPFSVGNKTGGFTSCLPDYQRKIPEIQKIDQENEFYCSPTVKNTDQHDELVVSENGNQQECKSNPVTPNVAKSQDDFQSPTFQFKTPILSSPNSTPKTDQKENYVSSPVTTNVAKSQDDFQSPTFQFKTPILSSPSSTPKTSQKENYVSSPASTEGTRFSLGTIRNLRPFEALDQDFSRPRQQKKSSHVEKLKYSVPRKEKSFSKEKKEEDGSSDSSYEERNFQGSHQGSRARHTAERKEFAHHPIKKMRKHKGAKFNDRSPAASVSSKGESDCEASEQNQDGFVRAVELFALELGKLKSKLKLATSQKSSEILKSVAEDIHSQLQDVNSQIRTDLGKLTNLGKSKRKRVETRFEDQQKQFGLIYERFKEEVNQHLKDCRSTVEDLEADQIEIKGALEKQRAAHKKLLSQVEEAVDVQLNDAQRKISATQEMARGKLLQLKQVIAMCLKEGLLS